MSGRPEPEWLDNIIESVDGLRESFTQMRAELAAWESFGPKPQLRALVAAAIAYGRHPEPWNDDRVIDSLLDAASNYELAR